MRKLVLPIDVLANNLMGIGKGKTDYLLSLIREGKQMTLGQQLRLTAYLSVPAIMAQISSIAMQYIDASMVGSLGANAAASIGLVSTTTWLFWGCVQPLRRDFPCRWHIVSEPGISWKPKDTPSSSYCHACFQFAVGCWRYLYQRYASSLVGWRRGDMERFVPLLQNIRTIPACLAVELSCRRHVALQWEYRVPAMLNIMMCLLDVVFNFFLIFPTRHVEWFGVVFTAPGAGLGVKGAILGTVLAELVTAGGMMWYLCRRSPMLKFVGERGSFLPKRETLRKSFRISLPMGFEHMAICGAQIATTVVVAPLGIVAIAANSFAIIAESLCYMPGYGISEAATTLVGQSLGANRIRLLRRFANITVWSGMLIMGVMGALIYVAAPQIIGVMTPVEEIRTLGIEILRIEAFAEPMFAASIVAYGVFVGVGNTFVPSLMNFGSIWGVRLTLAAWLAPTMGLRGVWLAMCIELCFRGVIFLARLWGSNWIYKLRINR